MEIIDKKKVDKKLLSPDLRERAVGYVSVRHFGIEYIIPVTKEFKKIFKMRIVKGKLVFDNYKDRERAAVMLRDLVASVYLQVRDVVADGITEDITRKVTDDFQKLFVKPLHKEVKGKLTKRIENKK